MRVVLPLLFCVLAAACTKESVMSSGSPPPAYLKRLAEHGDLYERSGDKLINASPEDVAVLRSYPSSGTVRGALGPGGRRVTLLTRNRHVKIGEPVRVIHVVEVESAGTELFVMGPKPVVGEYVDAKLVTDPIPQWGAFTMGVYDGAVLQSPGVDTNYEITTYRFETAGKHTIEWRAGPPGHASSNILEIDVR